MFTPSRISPVLGAAVLGLALCLAASVASADGPGLGKPVTEADIAAWDISIEPSGKGLPPGAGTPAQGAHIYVEKCAACHGPEGKAGVTGVTAAPLPPLVGGDPITDISAATKRIANFWPYPTTVFDYIRRSMPWQQPMTLANDEVYALAAYVLAQNKLIGDSDTMNAETLPKVKMPNRDGFIVRFPDANVRDPSDVCVQSANRRAEQRALFHPTLAADCLAKARQCLDEAKQIAALPYQALCAGSCAGREKH